MWNKGKLTLDKFKSVDCEVLPIMPFLSNGSKHLTPVNAVDLLTNKLASNDLIFAFLISSNSESDFIVKLENIANAFTLPEIKQALRISKTLSTLETNKMIIPAIDNSVASRPIITNQLRIINAAKTAGKNKTISISTLKESLSDFKGERQKIINKIKQSAQSAIDNKIDIDYFLGTIDKAKNNIPNDNHVYSLLVAFKGDNVQQLINLVAG